VKWNARLNVGQDVWFTNVFNWSLGSNFRLIFSERLNLKNLITGDGNYNYSTGVAVELKL